MPHRQLGTLVDGGDRRAARLGAAVPEGRTPQPRLNQDRGRGLLAQNTPVPVLLLAFVLDGVLEPLEFVRGVAGCALGWTELVAKPAQLRGNLGELRFGASML